MLPVQGARRGRPHHLPEPIKNVGTYMVVVDVVEGATATIKTMIVAKS